MSDTIQERLREWSGTPILNLKMPVLREAADEIDRLRAELDARTRLDSGSGEALEELDRIIEEKNAEKDAEIDRLRELLIETRAQIGMQVCGGCIHGPDFWAFLKHLADELGLDYCRLCEPGYPKWEPDVAQAAEGITHMVSHARMAAAKEVGDE
jgi:hypothetical protein